MFGCVPTAQLTANRQNSPSDLILKQCMAIAMRNIPIEVFALMYSLVRHHLVGWYDMQFEAQADLIHTSAVFGLMWSSWMACVCWSDQLKPSLSRNLHHSQACCGMQLDEKLHSFVVLRRSHREYHPLIERKDIFQLKFWKKLNK